MSRPITKGSTDQSTIIRRGTNFRDLTGSRFGRLTAVGPLPANKHGKVRWSCVCECGGTRSVLTGHLKTGATQSCGCLVREINRRNVPLRRDFHGGTGTPEHRVWLAMLNRCTSRTSDSWDRYGGRGISVCARWLDSFPNFLADMGPRPSLTYSIDRIDNSRGYEPGNCRWATMREQGRNRRGNLRLEHAGECKTLSEWCEVLGFKVSTVSRRLNRYGWSIDAALTTPAQARHPR